MFMVSLGDRVLQFNMGIKVFVHVFPTFRNLSWYLLFAVGTMGIFSNLATIRQKNVAVVAVVIDIFTTEVLYVIKTFTHSQYRPTRNWTVNANRKIVGGSG